MMLAKGAVGYVTNHASGGFLEPQEVMVLHVDTIGRHPVKVQCTAGGTILYCQPSQVKDRHGHPLKVPEAPVLTARGPKRRGPKPGTKRPQKPDTEKKAQEEEKSMQIITEAQAAEKQAQPVSIIAEAKAAVEEAKKERKESKPTFEEVKRLFMALSTAEALAEEHASLGPIIDLAEEQMRVMLAGGADACHAGRRMQSVSRVRHPSHYQSAGGLECWTVMEIVFGVKAVIAFCQCNVLKYLWRAGLKGSRSEDLRKAGEYSRKVESLRAGHTVSRTDLRVLQACRDKLREMVADLDAEIADLEAEEVAAHA